MEEKESDSHLFFICSRDVLLFLGRRILSQRLLQGMYIYIYTFPLLFFSISRKRHVVKHARCQTSPTTYSLSLLNYTRVKDPRGNAKKAIFKEYNFGRDIAASLVDKYRPPRHDKTYTKYAVSTDILGGGLGK